MLNDGMFFFITYGKRYIRSADGVVGSQLEHAGSWTNARWDQHLREHLGDEHAEVVIRWLAEQDIRPYIPEGTSGRLLQESIR